MFSPLYERLKFLPEHIKILQETRISEQEPGTILRDFNSLVDFIKENDVPLTPSQQLLSLQVLKEVNDRLANPIKLGLKRPQQKSYPHINGLYLLLRASGLTAVDESSKKPMLTVIKETHEKWMQLNPTEQYFILLETWLFRGKEEIIGEHGRMLGLPNHLGNWLWLYKRMPEGKHQVKGKPTIEQGLKYFPGMFNLGLLELFGLIHVEHGAVESGKGWQIETIEHSPLGIAILALLSKWIVESIEAIFDLGLEDQSESQIGVLQPVFQPYFPEWERNLPILQWAFRDGTYIFKVSLGKIWRTIEIGGKQVLDKLAIAIINSVDFDFDHLYEFSYRGITGATDYIHHPYMDDYPFTNEVRIGDIPLNIGQSMTYLFDFGDNWEFNVLLERIKEGGSDKPPKILKKHGKSPEQYHYW